MLSYVETVDTLRSKHTKQCIVCCVSCRYKMHTHVHMFLPVTSLIFNEFSIQKKFWNAESGLFNHTIKFYICQCMSKQSIHCVQNKLHSMACMSKQSIQNAYTCTHVSACNFLNIQWIFNPKKVLECWESGLFNHTIKFYICRCMSKQSIHCVQNKLHSMVCMSKQLIHCVQNKLHSMVCMSKQSIHCVLNKVHSMVRMSKQSIHCVQNKLHSMVCMSKQLIHCVLNKVHSMVRMSKQSIHCVLNKLHSMVRMSKQSIHCVRNTLDSMTCMSRRSIQASNYIVYHNSNYSNKEIHRINALNYSLFRIKT